MCQLAENSWSHFCYSPLNTRGSAGKAQLVKLLLHSTHHPWICWQTTAGHTSVTLHTSPVDQLQSTAGHTSVTLHSSPVDQLEEYSWSRFCYSSLITRGSAGRAQMVILLLLSNDHPCVSWQSTAGHTSVTLHSTPVDQLAKHSWSNFCYTPLITRGSAGRSQLVTLLLLSTHHPWISCRVQLVTLLLLSTHHPWISWKSTAGHASVTLHSSLVDQLAEHRWSYFCYSPMITHVSAGRVQLVTLLLLSSHHPFVSWQSTLVTLRLLSSHHPWISWQSTACHTSVTLHSSPVDQLAEYRWSHFGYSPLITRGSAGRAQLVTLLPLSTHNPWISWQTTSGHTSVTLHSSPMGQLGRAQLVTLLLLSTHNPLISWQSTSGHTSVTLHSSPVDQLAEHSWLHFCYSPLVTRGSAGRVQLVTLLLLSTHNPWISWQSTAGQT